MTSFIREFWGFAKLRRYAKDLRKTFLFAWSQMDIYVKLRLTGILALVLTSSVLSAFAPVVMKSIVDGFTSKTSSTERSWYLLVGLYVLVQWLTRAIAESRGFLYSGVERRMMLSAPSSG